MDILQKIQMKLYIIQELISEVPDDEFKYARQCGIYEVMIASIQKLLDECEKEKEWF